MIAAKKLTHTNTLTHTHICTHNKRERDTHTHMLLLLAPMPAEIFCKYLDIKALLQIFSFLHNVS
jgi:hypothetical protein